MGMMDDGDGGDSGDAGNATRATVVAVCVPQQEEHQRNVSIHKAKNKQKVSWYIIQNKERQHGHMAIYESLLQQHRHTHTGTLARWLQANSQTRPHRLIGHMVPLAWLGMDHPPPPTAARVCLAHTTFLERAGDEAHHHNAKPNRTGAQTGERAGLHNTHLLQPLTGLL